MVVEDQSRTTAASADCGSSTRILQQLWVASVQSSSALVVASYEGSNAAPSINPKSATFTRAWATATPTATPNENVAPTLTPTPPPPKKNYPQMPPLALRTLVTITQPNTILCQLD